jgi:nucleotide-binding universal stress UspA family protein
VSFGWAAAAIVHEAERGAFDLVVMGTQGLTGIGHFVLGSVAEKVVRTSPIPVITIPPLDAKATATFRKILVPVDFSPASRLALERALAFATSSHAIVHVLHVGEVPSHLQSDLSARSGVLKTSIEQRIREDAQAALSRFVEDVHPGSSAGVTTELRLGTPYRAILEACDQGEFALVAMGTHGRTGLSHLFVGSVAEKVIRMCKRPVLTVRPPTG